MGLIAKRDSLERNHSKLSALDNEVIREKAGQKVKLVATKALEPLLKIMCKDGQLPLPTPLELYEAFEEHNELCEPRSPKFGKLKPIDIPCVCHLSYHNLLLDKVYEDIVGFSSKITDIIPKSASTVEIDKAFKFITNFFLRSKSTGSYDYPICAYQDIFMGLNCHMDYKEFTKIMRLAAKHYDEIMDIFKPFDEDYPKLKELREFLKSTSIEIGYRGSFLDAKIGYRRKLIPDLEAISIVKLREFYSNVVLVDAKCMLTKRSDTYLNGVKCFVSLAILFCHMISCLTAKKNYYLNIIEVYEQITELNAFVHVLPGCEVLLLGNYFPEESNDYKRKSSIVSLFKLVLTIDQRESLLTIPTPLQVLFDSLGATKPRNCETKDTMSQYLNVNLDTYDKILPGLSLDIDTSERRYHVVDYGFPLEDYHLKSEELEGIDW